MVALIATALFWIIAVYALIGIVFAIVFVTRLAGKIDSAAREGTWGFKLLILPGAAAFWPLLLKRVLGGKSDPPEEKNAHRVAACQLHCDPAGEVNQ